jgi:hypothetical protein
MHSSAQRVPAASHTSRTHTTACPSCRKPMRGLELSGHYGKQVNVDLCVSCHMLWFDGHESVNLAGRGVLNLLRAIDESHGQSHLPLASAMQCPHCETRLQRSANLTSLGPTAQHECPRGHGAAQSFSLYLAEKGFVRPLYRPEVEQLRKRPQDRRSFVCLNCGAPLDPRERETCSHCGSPVKVIDMVPLLRAVDRQTGQLGVSAATGAGVPLRNFSCAHCGHTTDPTRERRCGGCAMPIALTELKQALALIEPFAAAIEAGAATQDHLQRRVSEMQASVPAGVPPSRPAHGYSQPLWLYAAAGAFMLILGIVLVWFARR